MSKNPLKKAAKLAFGINAVAAAIFVLIAGTAATAQTGHIKKSQSDKAASRAADEDADEYESVEVAGQTVAVDKKTGKLRQPTRDEAAALAEGMKKLVNQSADGLTPVYHGNGSISLDLQDRYQTIAVAKKNPDGTLTEACLSSPPEVDAFLGVVPKPIASRAAKATRGSRAKAHRRTTRREQTNDK
ncbi:MAG TPA: hypothetical protein VGC87_21825 [Pyrinomonadaceae bacterium]|jgi:hypothetical protein